MGVPCQKLAQFPPVDRVFRVTPWVRQVRVPEKSNQGLWFWPLVRQVCEFRFWWGAESDPMG